MIKGLNNNEVKLRYLNNQVNSIDSNLHLKKDIIFKNIFSFYNILNLILFIIIITLSDIRNALFIFAPISNTIINIFYQVKALNLINNTNIITSSIIKVLRDDQLIDISDDKLVIDDVIYVDRNIDAPCDLKLIDGEVFVDESCLTGESDLIHKNINDEILQGSTFINSNAYLKVIRLRNNTSFNSIVNATKSLKKDDSFLKLLIYKILKYISFSMFPITLLMFIKQYLTHISLIDNLTSISSSLIQLIPQGLIILISSSLTLSCIKLFKKSCLINNLYSIENLCKCKTVCFDKTGTLTLNKSNIYKVINYTNLDVNNIIANINNLSNCNNQTNFALKSLIIKSKLDMKLICDFSSKTKFIHTKLNLDNYYLGAYEFIEHTFNKNIQHDLNYYCEKGYRCLALVENKTVLALVVIENKLRDSSNEILNYLKQKQVKTLIISGDNKTTISSLLKRLNQDANVLDCYMLSDNELILKCKNYNAFARSNPHQKNIIVNEYKNDGYVCYVGDGINDIEAMKQSNFSITFNSSKKVIQQVSDCVFLDDDFKHIKDIIDIGHLTISNTTKSSILFLCKTLLSLFISLFSIFVFNTYPFKPIQFTLISTLCIGISSIVIIFDKNIINFSNIESQILKQVLPFSIVSAISILLLYIFSNNFISVSFVYVYLMFISLNIKVFYPLNIFKFSLLSSSFLIFVLCITFFKVVFYINDLLLINYLEIAMLFIFSQIILYVFKKAFK